MAEKITLLNHLRKGAEAARDFVGSLVAELAAASSDALDEMDAIKADRSTSLPFILPTAGWETDTAVADYPYTYDLPAEGVTAADMAAVSIAPASMATAIACGLCGTCETTAGKIRFRAKALPASAISAEYRIDQGKEN